MEHEVSDTQVSHANSHPTMQVAAPEPPEQTSNVAPISHTGTAPSSSAVTETLSSEVPELSAELQRVLKPVSSSSSDGDVSKVAPTAKQPRSLNDQQVFAQAAEQFLMHVVECQFDESFHSLLLQKNALQRIAQNKTSEGTAESQGVYSYEDSCLLVEINELKLGTALNNRLSDHVAKKLEIVGGPSGARSLGGSRRGRGGRRGGRGGTNRNVEGRDVATSKPNDTSSQVNVTNPEVIDNEIDHLCELIQNFRLVCNAQVGESTFNNAMQNLEKLFVSQLSTECDAAMSTLSKQRRFKNQQDALQGANNKTNGNGDSSASSADEENVYEVALRLLLGVSYTPLVKLSKLFVDATSVERDNKAVNNAMNTLLRGVSVPQMVKVLDAFSHDKMVKEWAELCKAQSGNLEMDVMLLGTVLRELAEIIRLCKEFLNWIQDLMAGSEHAGDKSVQGEEDPIHTLSVRVDYMLDSYTAMEICWFLCNAKKAAMDVTLTEHGFGDTVQVYSIVENTFYVAKSVAWVRAEHTTVGHAMCAVANTVCQYLGDRENGYTRGITDLILECRKNVGGPGTTEPGDDSSSSGIGVVRSGSSTKDPSKEIDNGNAFDAFDAILREETQGVSVLRAPRLFAINSAELSVLYLSQLAHEISDSFLDSSVSSMIPLIGMALDTLKETAMYHDQLRVAELTRVADDSLSSHFDSAIGALIKHTSYEPNHGQFAQLQRDNPFMAKFVQEYLVSPTSSMQLCKKCLSHRNFAFLLQRIGERLAKTMESHVFRLPFNELGAMLLDTDVSLLVDSLVALIPVNASDHTLEREVRNYFARLRQVVTLLGFNAVKDVEQFDYPLAPVLTDPEVREILALRFARSQETLDVIRGLDVTKYVRKDEQVPVSTSL